MNKIFKKVFNRSRGVFVAVSEAVSSASQQNKKSVLVAAAVLSVIASPAVALTTIDGDVFGKDSRIPFQSRGTALSDSTTINGNYTWNIDRSEGFRHGVLTISIGADYYSSLSNTLTVEKNFRVTNNGSVNIAHNGDRGGDIYSSLVVKGDAIIDSGSDLSLITSGDSGNDPTMHVSLIVNGTLYNNGSLYSIGGNEARKTYGSFAINNFVNNGSFWFDSPNDLNGTFNNVTQAGGSFQQLAINDFHINGTLTVSGGTIINNDLLVVGTDSGKFSVGQVLNLAGGSVSNLSVLTHVGGSVLVSSGSYGIGTLNKSNGSLTNQATLTITNFNQSNGTAANSGNLTIGSADLGGSLANTGTLSLTGNVTTRGNLTSTGTLNNRGNWTETAHYAISGSLNNSGSVNFQNGFEFAANGRLNSSGTLQTNNAANIFDSLGRQGQTALSTVSLQAALPEEVKTSLTDLFRHYVPGTVAQSLIDHASFTGGKVIVTGVNLTTTQCDDLVQAFKAKFFLPDADASTSAVSQQC